MRRWILLIMIALLPMRGWVGDAMATDMASSSRPVVAEHHKTATKIVAGHAHSAGAADHIDHASASQAGMAAGTDCFGHGGIDEASAGAHCNTCTVCQVCHTVALSPPFIGHPPVLNPIAPPHSPVAMFASADPASGQKPPIS